MNKRRHSPLFLSFRCNQLELIDLRQNDPNDLASFGKRLLREKRLYTHHDFIASDKANYTANDRM